jgi:hypothetical protein
MLHCRGGRGPNDVTIPALMALTAWVEKNEPPARLVIHQTVDNDPAKPPLRTRPLCAYPKVAGWDGKGDRNAAEHWLCKAPAKAA